jgi:hypothetical protein
VTHVQRFVARNRPILVLVGAYALAWGVFLTRDLAALAGAVTAFWPIYVVVFGVVHVGIGYWVGRTAVAWICLIPIGLSIALAPAMPVDPDFPGYPIVIFMVLVFPVMPLAAGVTGLGVWLSQMHTRAA